MTNKILITNLKELISQDHRYIKFNELLEMKEIEVELLKLEKENRYKGYGMLFRCVLLQFMEDLSDRQDVNI